MTNARAFKSRSYLVTETSGELTVVLAPWKNHRAFMRSIDALYVGGGPRFRLIVVDGNAPESLRQEIERCARRHGNIRPIFTGRTLNTAQAWNLAMPHIRTSHVFFSTTQVMLNRKALGHLLGLLPASSAGIIRPAGSPALHGFLTTRQTLERLSFFDEDITSEAAFERFLEKSVQAGIPLHISMETPAQSVPKQKHSKSPVPAYFATPVPLSYEAKYSEDAESLNSLMHFARVISKSFSKQAKRA